MGLLDKITAWFKTESAEAAESVANLESAMHRDLDAKERALEATAEQRLDMIQDEIDSSNGLDAIRDKIEGTQAKADATTEINELESTNEDD